MADENYPSDELLNKIAGVLAGHINGEPELKMIFPNGHERSQFLEILPADRHANRAARPVGADAV